MAYYPRIFYYPEDEGGGDDPTRAAALSMGQTPEEVEALTKAYEDQAKAQQEIDAARNAGNEDLVAYLEVQLQLNRELSEVSNEQLDQLRQRRQENADFAEAQRQAEEEINRELQLQIEAEASLVGFATEMWEALKKQTGELDKQRVALGKGTGLFGQFNQQLTDSVAAAARFGKGAEEVGNTIGSLSDGMMNFTQLSDANQKTLIDGSLALSQFGIDAGTAAKANDFLMNSLGKSAEESVTYQKELVELGHEIGMSGAKLAEKFGTMAEDLAKYGDKAGDVFKNLAKTAKATGVEMSLLLNVAGKFDTFEGAAGAVGKLNAQMGTNLDAMSLLQEEDPAKRVEMLRDSFLATGKDLASMSRFEKMAAAEAMGMKLPELQKFLAPKKEATETDKNFDELLEKTTTFADKLAAVGKQFAVFFTPVISILVDVLEWVGQAVSWFGELTKKISENKAIVYTLATVLGTLMIPVLVYSIALATKSLDTKVKLFFERVKELALGYKKLVLDIKANAILLKNNIAAAAEVVWLKLKAAATWLYTAAMNSSLVALIRTTAATIASGVATAGLNIATGLATGATWLFNAALAANPIGLVIIAVVALVGALYLLWDNMAAIGEFFTDIWDSITASIQAAIDLATGALDTIGGWFGFGGEEETPGLAGGTPNFQGGKAIVGEKGPELVNLPRGAEVIPNDKLAPTGGSKAGAAKAADEKPPVIKLILNERELGQAVLDVIDKKLSVFMGVS